MLSDLILEHKGNAARNRILNADIQKQETTVTARGKVRGSLDVSIIITYWNLPRSDKSGNHHNDSTTLQCYYGEGGESYQFLVMDIVLRLSRLLNTE